ncbi:orotate phosphoribosyltransferase [Coemansia sp. RSA 2681]|nr:orotate phosphoribosyltransferase [Coemansia sp. RSA 2681]
MATPEAPLREFLKSISFTRFPLCHIDPFFVPAAIDRPQLFVYRSPLGRSSGTPTSDIECLRVLSLLKFHNYEFDLQYTHEPNMSPNAQLPFLLLPSGTAIDCHHIEEHLADKLEEKEEDDEQEGGLLAYYEMAKHGLVPAAEYLAWVDPAGLEAIGQHYLAPYSSLPKYWLGWSRVAAVTRRLRSALPEYGAALDGDVIYENAMRALDSLLVLLGEKETMSGRRLGSLDALVFACLNAFLEAPVKSPMRDALTRPGSKYRPLVDYLLRIVDRYYKE